LAVGAAAVDLDADRVVLGGVAPTPVLVERAGTAEEIAGALELRDEPGISAHYRRGLVRTLVQRARKEASRG
jgi:carbon-monoxide dehydrogenase medium subunit